jgi:nicotinamide-nucleotide amidase
MKAEIVMIGSELLLGQIVDTNATYLAQQLNNIGIGLYYKTTVGDNPGRMEEVLNQALNRSDIVIASGGLGPTDDDITREIAAKVTGRELEFKQDLMDHIESLFRKVGMRMSPSNRRQAYIPKDSMSIPNPRGTAPGFIVEESRAILIAIPGVPGEVKFLMENSVIPYLREKFGLGQSIIKSRVLKLCGISESALGETIKDLLTTSKNPTLGILAKQGDMEVRVTAKASSEPEADSLISGMEEEVRRRLGPIIYGTDDDTLEEVVCALLQEMGLSLSVLETNSGGLVAQRLVSIAPRVLKEGFVAISDAAKKRLAVKDVLEDDGPSQAALLAENIRRVGGSDLGLAVLSKTPLSPIGEKAREEIDYGQTYFAFASDQGVTHFEYGFGGWSKDSQPRTATVALEVVRRNLKGMKMEFITKRKRDER